MANLPRGNLAPINFAERSATEIRSYIITIYESISGRVLSQSDPIRLFLEAIATIIINQRSVIDFAAKQNLLSYTTDEYVDYLAELVGVKRNQAEPAKTTIRFTLSQPLGSVYTVPAGTLLNAGALEFSTTEDLDIAIGQVTGDVTAECTTPGTIGNNLLPGQIRVLVEPLPYVSAVENITTSNGGSEREGVESMVERIRLAPSSFSVAGPRDAYIYWALTANPAIIDVSVSTPDPDNIRELVYSVLESHSASPELISDMQDALENATWPGTVDVRPLLEGGTIPQHEVLDQVNSVLSADDVRPFTDVVEVNAPEVAGYNVDVDYWVRSADAASSVSIQAAVNAAVQDYIKWQKTKIGRDIVPDELIHRMMSAGAKRVVVNSPTYTVLDDTQVAQEGTVIVEYQGLEDA